MSYAPQSNFLSQCQAINVGDMDLPFFFRPIGEDIALVRSIFGSQEYRLPWLKNFRPKLMKLILDCGAHIGCAAVYFANVYPTAQIYSIEPEESNFQILQYNSIFYHKIHPIQSALWDKETFVHVRDIGGGTWAFVTLETKDIDENALRTITVSKLLRASGFDEIDLLKIDIEGAEKEVFGAPNVDEWLSKVKVLVVELHDHKKRGSSYELFKAVSKYKWFFRWRGENLIFIRENLIFKE